LSGFENIKSDVVTVHIDVSADAWHSLDYKALKGIAMMDRYHEKRAREIAPSCSSNEMKNYFREKFNLDSTSLSEFLKEKI